MSVWICIPSIRPGGGTLPTWHRLGYRVAVLRQGEPLPYADLQIPTDHYLGWAPSINRLVRAVMAQDPDAQWIVGGGDDTLPDPNRGPAEIASECSEHFGLRPDLPWLDGVSIDKRVHVKALSPGSWQGSTFGVMQPTGDLALWPGSRIDNFAGSPWMGREFCKRMYGGAGPLFEGYRHMFGDEELQEVATDLGVFWQRPDLIHLHEHWGRRPGGARREDIPPFLQEVNTFEHWEESRALFQARKGSHWPGHEPIS